MTSPCLSEPIQIPHCGIGATHQPGFCIDRPNGTSFYIFAHFQSPVRILDREGIQSFAQNGAILYAPGFPQWYRSDEYEMNHSWFHCIGAGECVERYRLPINRALDLGPFGHLVPFLQDVRRQQLRQEHHWQEAVSLRAQLFFLELGRAVQQLRALPTTRYRYHILEVLRQVRTTVHSDLARSWTVSEMADLANLSASRFTALYSELFELSPFDDLIDARIKRACSLLVQTPYTVESVATQCGFNNPAHFCRLFRKRMGCPPSRYR